MTNILKIYFYFTKLAKTRLRADQNFYQGIEKSFEQRACLSLIKATLTKTDIEIFNSSVTFVF